MKLLNFEKKKKPRRKWVSELRRTVEKLVKESSLKECDDERTRDTVP